MCSRKLSLLGPLLQIKYSRSISGKPVSSVSQPKEKKFLCLKLLKWCRLAQLPGEGANFLVSAVSTGEHKWQRLKNTPDFRESSICCFLFPWMQRSPPEGFAESLGIEKLHRFPNSSDFVLSSWLFFQESEYDVFSNISSARQLSFWRGDLCNIVLKCLQVLGPADLVF